MLGVLCHDTGKGELCCSVDCVRAVIGEPADPAQDVETPLEHALYAVDSAAVDVGYALAQLKGAAGSAMLGTVKDRVQRAIDALDRAATALQAAKGVHHA